MKQEISEEFVRLMGMSINEKMVFCALSYGQFLSIAEIVRKTRLPRMTIYSVLDRLIRRGIIVSKKRGNIKRFTVVQKNVLSSYFLNANTTSVGEFIHGSDKMFSMWEEISNLPKDTRVLALQPTASIKEVLKKLVWNDSVQQVQKRIVEKPIIIEGLLSEDYYPFILNFFAKNNNEMAKSAVKSFLGRATDMVFVQSDVLKVAVEMYVLPESLFIADWKKEEMVRITDKNIVNFMRELFGLVRGYGRKIDQNSFLRDLLNETQNK